MTDQWEAIEDVLNGGTLMKDIADTLLQGGKEYDTTALGWAQQSVTQAEAAVARSRKNLEAQQTVMRNYENGFFKTRVDGIAAKLTELGVEGVTATGRSWRGTQWEGKKLIGNKKKKVTGNLRCTSRGVTCHVSTPVPAHGYEYDKVFLTLRYFSSLTVANKELDLVLGA